MIKFNYKVDGEVFRECVERKGEMVFSGRDSWFSIEDQVFESNKRMRKRLGARLFELADEHLPERQSQLLREWANGATQKQLSWKFRGELTYGAHISKVLEDIFAKVRKLSDDDLESQMLLAALDKKLI